MADIKAGELRIMATMTDALKGMAENLGKLAKLLNEVESNTNNNMKHIEKDLDDIVEVIKKQQTQLDNFQTLSQQIAELTRTVKHQNIHIENLKERVFQLEYKTRK